MKTSESPGTAADILKELQHMTPGKSVVYGYHFDMSRIFSAAAVEERRKINEIVQVLDRANMVMLFHRRLPSGQVVCIARGVDPSIRLRIEAALARCPFPS
jgi:hypothetical protein